jgi:hypothetical protein
MLAWLGWRGGPEESEGQHSDDLFHAGTPKAALCRSTLTKKQEAFMTSEILRGGVLAVVCGAVMASTAVARSPYDGGWSVTFYTRSGVCDAAYRSGVIIQNGLIYPEASGINFSGRVSPNGAVRASVSAAGQYASGAGRLGRSSGGGVWRGQGGRGACSGAWAAERRG